MKYDVFIQNAEFFLGIELISFKKKLEGTDWSPIYDEDHLPKAFSIFQETFTTIFEDIFPLKEFLIKYKNRDSHLIKGLKMSIKNKHILWDTYEKIHYRK